MFSNHSAHSHTSQYQDSPQRYNLNAALLPFYVLHLFLDFIYMYIFLNYVLIRENPELLIMHIPHMDVFIIV